MATKNFSEVVGQSHVLTALENGLKKTVYIMLIYFPAPVAWVKPPLLVYFGERIEL